MMKSNFIMNDSISYEDIIKLYESLPKINKSEVPKAIFVNKKTFPKLLDQLDVVQLSSDYIYFRGADVLIRESVPDNQVIMEMQDGSGKIFELE
jgi:hypothetical protein